MSKADTAPAAETENAEPASIADLVAERHQALPDHEAHKEVGEDPDDEPAPAAAVVAKTAPAPVAPAAPAAAAPAAPAATDFDALAKDPKFQEWMQPKLPKWARESIKEKNAELERARNAPMPAPQPRPAAPQAEMPNPAEDPQGYHDAVSRDFNARMQRFEMVQTLRLSERFAVQQHGTEKFEDCRAWLSTKPDIEAWALQQPDPWGAAFTQYTREQLAEEIGDDPNAWREKERQRLREEILAEQAERDQHIPARAQAPQMRSAPPAPASTARSAAPRDDSGRFAPAPLTSLTKNKFG
jgi:hypothetical protein